MSPDSLDAQILDCFWEINPSGAYILGFNNYAGKLFIASKANVNSALKRVRALRSKAKTELQRKVLDSVETNILFDEPQPVLDDIVGTIFAHLAKEGVNEEHMLSLLDYAMKDVDACAARFSHRPIPVAIKALTLYRLDGVLEILDTVKRESKNPKTKRMCDALKAKVIEYVKLFELEGWGKGEFDNVERIFKEKGSAFGREKFYTTALRKGFDYTETPEQLEKSAISWIDEELPRFRKVTEQLAKKFGCDPTPQDVEEAIIARTTSTPRSWSA